MPPSTRKHPRRSKGSKSDDLAVIAEAGLHALGDRLDGGGHQIQRPAKKIKGAANLLRAGAEIRYGSKDGVLGVWVEKIWMPSFLALEKYANLGAEKCDELVRKMRKDPRSDRVQDTPF